MTAMGQVIEFSRQEVSISAGHAESMPTKQRFLTAKKQAEKLAARPEI